MSDQNTSLPIRTEAAGDVIVKVGDKTVPSQQLVIDSAGLVGAKTFDGSGVSIGSTSGALNVAVTSSGALVADKAAFTYGTTNQTVIGAVFQDTAPTVTAGQQAGLRMNAARGLHSNLRDSSGAELVGQKAMSASVPVTLASDQTALAVSQNGTWNITNITGTITLPTGASSSANQTAANASLTSIDSKLSSLGQKVSASSAPVVLASDQPAIAVYITDSPGVEINDYSTVAAVAAAATSNHDYTVTTAKTLRMTQFEAAGSGKIKVEVQVETGVATGSFLTKFVKFNSTSTPGVSVPLSQPITVAAGVRVRVIRTNLDKSAQDVYSTICGYEV